MTICVVTSAQDYPKRHYQQIKSYRENLELPLFIVKAGARGEVGVIVYTEGDRTDT